MSVARVNRRRKRKATYKLGLWRDLKSFDVELKKHYKLQTVTSTLEDFHAARNARSDEEIIHEALSRQATADLERTSSEWAEQARNQGGYGEVWFQDGCSLYLDFDDPSHAPRPVVMSMMEAQVILHNILKQRYSGRWF